MKDECAIAVEDALGRQLFPGESKRIEDAVNAATRQLARENPADWMKLSQTERMMQASARAAENLTAEAKLKQLRTKLQIQVHERIENDLGNAFERIKAKAGQKMRAVSQLLAFDASGKGLTSVETWTHSISNQAFARLIPLWNSTHGFLHLFENSAGVRDVVKELFGEESGNGAAKAGAKVWGEVTDDLRDRANKTGMNIGKLDEWRFPQSHSQTRVAQAGVEKWIAETMPLLDREKYVNLDGTRMNDDQLSQFLMHAWDSIATGGVNKQEPGMQRNGTTANRQSQHRELFFKDSDSYLNYQGKYGDRNLWSVMTGHIRSISRDIALNEILGPNAERTFQHFNDRTRLDELREFPEKADKINTAHKFNQALYDTVSGRSNVVNNKIQDIGQSFRNWEVATKLGQVAISALGDEAGMSATAFANKVPWSEAFAREFKMLNPANPSDRALAAHAGLGLNTMISGLNRFGSEDLELGRGLGAAANTRVVTARLAGKVLHWSGAEAMWDGRRRALGSVLMSYLGKTVGQVDRFADINAADHGILANKGITETDWQVWKMAELEDWGMKHGVLTPQSVWNIPDSKLVNLGDPTQMKRHASTMLLGHILEETGMGVMDSGARERTRMTFGTQAGTVAGELTRSAMLFKGFSASMMMKHWARAGSMDRASDTAQYAARLVVMGTILGAVANQVRGLVAGRDPSNIAEPKFWGEAALRGGGLGFYGDFLYSELTSHDTSLIPALMGPLATEAENLWNLTGGALFKHQRGERTDELPNLIRWAKGNVPVINNWYTRAALDHFIWNEMQEAASPGYLDRMTAKAQAQRGTSYWWDPQDKSPERAPDLSKLIQPERGKEQLAAIANALRPSE